MIERLSNHLSNSSSNFGLKLSNLSSSQNPEVLINRVFVFSGPLPWPWPLAPALAPGPNLYLTTPAPNLYWRPRLSICIYLPRPSICVRLFFVLQLKFVIVTCLLIWTQRLIICTKLLSIMWATSKLQLFEISAQEILSIFLICL